MYMMLSSSTRASAADLLQVSKNAFHSIAKQPARFVDNDIAHSALLPYLLRHILSKCCDNFTPLLSATPQVSSFHFTAHLK